MRPTMVYDGDCAFCKRWIMRWQSVMSDAIDFEPYQTAAAKFPRIDRRDFGNAVHLIEPAGEIHRGAGAVFRAYELANRKRWLNFCYQFVPGFALIAERVYRFIAHHRDGFDKLDGWFIGYKVTAAPTYRRSRWLLLRAIGVIYLIAFISYWVQIDGLIGSKGILPVREYLDFASEQLGSRAHWIFPTLCWFDSSDRFLHILCATGVACSSLLILDFAALPMLIVLWIAYLSLTVAGQEFLSFQWDSLLLEAGLAAMFVAPWTILPGIRRQREPPMTGIWLMRWLAFRIMFLSGVVKLSSGDVTWRDWTALRYHYQTQPLPTWTSWYMQQMPAWFGAMSMGVMFFAELVAPFFIFGTRRMRIFAFFAIVIFQLLIAGTGNYGFFNFLTIAICLSIPDDSLWTRARQKAAGFSPPVFLRARTLIAAPIVALIFFVTTIEAIGCFATRKHPIGLSPPIEWVLEQVGPYRSMNSYGLFRVMTTRRPEITIEGSDDGVTWKPYIFRYKPGEDLTARPKFCEPHMPRLDWQMWFAALGSYQNNPWIIRFMERLLENSPPVLDLLAGNPFPDHPPRYVRALLYEYHFTDAATRAKSGAWWRRELLGLYCPVISFKNMSQSTETEFDKLWDYNDPAGTETKFRALDASSLSRSHQLQLQTQIARTLGLQGKFDSAHAILDQIEPQLDDAAARVRYLLERGRTYNSSDKSEAAMPLFISAAKLAEENGLDFFAVDALHMIAIAENDPQKQLHWNLKAIAFAEKSADARARGWLGSLCNNLGWTYFDMNRFDDALATFRKALEHREQSKKPELIQIAHYCIGKTLRALGRIDEALAELTPLKREKFVSEEIEACERAKAGGGS